LDTFDHNAALSENAKNSANNLNHFSSINFSAMEIETLNAEDELISKLKQEIGKRVPSMFAGMAENMLESNKDVIINWLKENKNLVKEVIES
jgi:hypothetical protein